MAASPTPRPTRATSAEPDATQALAGALAAWGERHLPGDQGPPIGVAFSGGADSTALVLSARARWGDRVKALHVHHGLQAAADDFERHVSAFCARHGVPLIAERVDARAAVGQSPEDAARDARYRALARMAQQSGAAVVLLGQHADDQAETLLLALSRGAGLPGLAAMSERFERHGMAFGRPWLGVPAHTLRAALQQGGHAHIDDPSNTDQRFTRNRIRHQLVPAWERAFPGVRQALLRTAAHAAQAQRLLDELAAIDLAVTGEPPDVDALRVLARDRRANALRHWLKRREGVSPSAAQLEGLLDQIEACRTRGHRIRLKVARGFVERDGARLRYTPSV